MLIENYRSTQGEAIRPVQEAALEAMGKKRTVYVEALAYIVAPKSTGGSGKISMDSFKKAIRLHTSS